MHDPTLSEYDRLRAEYEDEMFSVTTELTPTEIRQIIAQRRQMEEHIGTNGSIQLTMKIAQSVHVLMEALAEHQVRQENPDDDVVEPEDVEDEQEEESSVTQ